MSPSSYANTSRRSFVKPVKTPVHRRIMVILRRQSCSRNRLLIIISAVLVTYYLVIRSPQRTGEDMDQPLATRTTPISFAPTQISHDAAIIRFVSGIEQKIHIAPLRHATHLNVDSKYVNLWQEGEIESVIIPLGGSLSFTDTAGAARKLWRVSSTCDRGECEGIGSLKFEQDVTMALHQMKTSGKRTLACPR